MDYVVSLLQHTFGDSGSGTTESVKEATDIIVSKITSPENSEFYLLLLQIIFNPQINVSIRQAALNVFIQTERTFTDFFPYELFISNISQILLATTADIRESVSVLLDLVISHTLFQGVIPNPLELFNSLIQQDVTAGLIFANSLCEGISLANDDQLELYNETSTQLLNILTQILQNNDLLSSAYCMSCAFSLIKFHIPPFFAQSQENLSLWVHASLEFSNLENSENENYNFFAQKALKFTTQVLYKSSGQYPQLDIIPDDCYDVFDAVANLITFMNPPETQSLLAEIVDVMISHRHTWNMMSMQMDNAVQYILLPFFALSVEEIEFTKNEETAPDFISSVMTTPFNSSDPRMYILGKLRIHCKDESKAQVISQSVCGYLTEMVKVYANEESASDELLVTLFGALLMFSAVGYSLVRNNQELANSMLSMLAELLSSNDILVKCGALLGIDSFEIGLPSQIISALASLFVSEDHLLVRYYAANAFSNAISILPDDDQLKNEIAQELESILRSFVELAEFFNDTDFFRGLSKFVRTFGRNLAEHGSEVSNLLIEIFQANFDPQKPEKSNAALSALSSLSPFLSQESQFELLTFVASSASENGVLSNELLDFAANLIAAANSITADHWNCVKLICDVVVSGTQYSAPLFFVSSAVVMIKNIILKDANFPAADTTSMILELINVFVEAGSSTMDANIVNPAITLCFTVTNKMGANLPADVLQMFAQISSNFMNDNRFQAYSSNLFASLIIATSGSICQMMPEIFTTWVEVCGFFELVIVLEKVPAVFGDGYINIICKIISMLEEVITRPLYDIEDSVGFDLETYIIVNELSYWKEETVMNDFAQILTTLHPEQKQAIQQAFPEKNIDDLANEIRNFFVAKSQIKTDQ